MQSKRRMTAEEFEAVRQRLEGRINAQRLEAARLALVEGMKLQSVADRFNWSARQTVNTIVRIACDDLAEYRKLAASGACTRLMPVIHPRLVQAGAVLCSWESMLASCSLPQGPPKYECVRRSTKLMPYHEVLRQALKADAHRAKRERRTARTLYAEIKATGYEGGYRCVADFIREWRQGEGHGVSTKTFVPLNPGEFYFATLPIQQAA